MPTYTSTIYHYFTEGCTTFQIYATAASPDIAERLIKKSLSKMFRSFPSGELIEASWLEANKAYLIPPPVTWPINNGLVTNDGNNNWHATYPILVPTTTVPSMPQSSPVFTLVPCSDYIPGI